MVKIIIPAVMLFGSLLSQAQQHTDHVSEGRSIIFTNPKGERLRLTPYGDYIIRIQAVRKGEEFFADDRYEMVETHKWPGSLKLVEEKNYWLVQSQSNKGIVIKINKDNFYLSFAQKTYQAPFLRTGKGIWWEGDTIHASFVYDPEEHFTGLGHGYFGRAEHLDLSGQFLQRNYGSDHGQQAPLIVPFYLSGKGYGVFLNSSFPNAFNFGKDGQYEFSLAGNGRMDYFVILGPAFSAIIDRYTQLTGRPRFPPKTIFGLALSDKANDHLSSAPSNENWWKEKIIQHRNAGYPIDHIVNDNRWRAGGGERCRSFFEWDTTRFPHPAEYEQWIRTNGLYSTIDFNRCIAAKSEGWLPAYNISGSDSVDFGESAPDFSRKEVRKWFWNLQWKKSLNPALGYPGDALWIDEFDEMGRIPLTTVMGNGRTWQEMKNYWFFLISKSLVQEGWDKNFHGTKRPFVWVRGMTAGAQRYATLWSGDIKPNYDDMKNQVRGLQLAGLSGFPFWGHDAGGFYDWETKKGPDDLMYRQWSMAFGSFCPFWKPHGVGESRWPLDRSAAAQKDAMVYCRLRYELIPYTYTYAHISAETGMPMARAMVIDHQDEAMAWKSELQYMWGNEILVAPNCSDSGNVNVWLPGGDWYDFWSNELYKGNQTIQYPAPTGKLPLFVKPGAIIPMADFALSTAFISSDSLTLRVYTGKNGSFDLYEDDGITENYKRKNERRVTAMKFNQNSFTLSIAPSKGNYSGATDQRTYRVDFYGLSKPLCLKVNGKKFKTMYTQQQLIVPGEGVVWNGSKKILSVFIPQTAITKKLIIQRAMNCPL